MNANIRMMSLLKYLKSKEETEGLVQDVFLKIWENRKTLKKNASLKSYLFTICLPQHL